MSEQTQPETALQSLAEKLRTDAIAIFGEGQAERDIIEWFYGALLAAAQAPVVPEVPALWAKSLGFCWAADADYPEGDWIVGTVDEDGNRYDVLRVEASQYDAEGESQKIAEAIVKLWAWAAHPAERQEQEALHVWRATTRFGETCHFGEASCAKAWAGQDGKIERVDLKPAPDLQVVEQADQPSAASVPAGCKVVPVELLERLEHVTRTLVPHLQCHVDLRALLASVEGGE